MVGIRRPRKVPAMAGSTLCGSTLEPSILVARDAGDRLMSTRKREAREIVIKTLTPIEGGHTMAGCTIRGETGRRVVGIRGGLEVFAMASDAGHGGAGILMGRSIRMTAPALQCRMATQERETGALMPLDHVRDLP